MADELALVDAGSPDLSAHACSHRKEGDALNAGYWYRRAGKPPANGALEQGWGEIAAALLARA
jgi:hypothetical protein